MLKRLLQIAILLVAVPPLVVGEDARKREEAAANSAGAPRQLTDAQRADYATAIARVAIAQARMSEARSAFLEAQAQHEALMKAARAEIEKLRKANGAASVCEIDLEGKWQCATGSR